MADIFLSDYPNCCKIFVPNRLVPRRGASAENADHAAASAGTGASSKFRSRSNPQLTGERTAQACDIC
jgi:hypothetical protein